MSCELFRESLVLHLCGELKNENETELQGHLEVCEGCRKELSEMRAILGLARQLPEREFNENLCIQDLLRQSQRWRTIVFSKAALWMILLTAAIAAVSYLPIQWEISAEHFSVRWGTEGSGERDLAKELQNLQQQLANIQQQNQNFYQVSEARMKQIADHSGIEQEKRYWQTLEMFTSYVQAQRKADLQKIQHELATSYDRAGNEVEKTNELLEYVLQASATDASVYEGQ